MFIGVCLSIGGVPGPGVCLLPGGVVPGLLGGCLVRGRVLGGDPPGWLLLRAVRILLECILVLIIFLRTSVLFVGPLIPPPLGFKARVGNLNHTWLRRTCWPLGGQYGSQVDLFLFEHVPTRSSGGSRISPRWISPKVAIIWPIFSPKLHEIERIWTVGGAFLATFPYIRQRAGIGGARNR